MTYTDPELGGDCYYTRASGKSAASRSRCRGLVHREPAIRPAFWAGQTNGPLGQRGSRARYTGASGGGQGCPLGAPLRMNRVAPGSCRDDERDDEGCVRRGPVHEPRCASSTPLRSSGRDSTRHRCSPGTTMVRRWAEEKKMITRAPISVVSHAGLERLLANARETAHQNVGAAARAARVIRLACKASQ